MLSLLYSLDIILKLHSRIFSREFMSSKKIK